MDLSILTDDQLLQPTLGCGNTYVRDLGRGHAELSGIISNLLPPSKL